MGLYKFTPDDAFRFAREQGIQARPYGKELRFKKCPFCKNNTDDKNTFAISLETGQFKCLRASCNAHGNMITLRRVFGFSLGTDVDEYYQQKRKYRNLSNYPRPEVRPKAIEYLEGRGISKATAERYSITTQKEHENILVFPFFDDSGKMQFIKYRNTEYSKETGGNKEWCESNCKPILFGMDRCNLENKTLIMTEGQIDSLSVSECGIENAVSVPTGAKGFTWVPYCWDFLCKFETLIIFGDHENGKITLLEEMQHRFNGTVKHVRPEDYKDCKDANELLRKYGAGAVMDAVNQAVPVENARIVDLSEVERKSMAEMENISTGIKELDRRLGGFFFGQLIILTGERGLGKSTLGSQFCVQAVQQGQTAFMYSGEMMDWNVQDWFDRQAAGPRYINKVRTDYCGDIYMVDGNCIDDIHGWYKGKCYLYDNRIIGEAEEDETLLETTENAIKQYGCRVLLLDNLMTAMDDDMTNDQYRQQTAFVRKLALMAKQYNVLIFLVVHPRKTGAGEHRNDDVSGSSNITNLADVVMWYEKGGEDSECDRVLKVTKNRLNGKTGKGIELWFDEASKRISEKQNSFNWAYGWQAQMLIRHDFDHWDEIGEEIPF